MVILYSVQQLCATALNNMGWSLLIPFCCLWMSDAYWDCTDITRWRRLCIKWDCIQKESWFSSTNALQRNQKVMHLFLWPWTTNGTICSTLGVLFFESWNNPLKAGANDKVGLWMGAAVNLKSQAIVLEEKTFGRGLNNTDYCKKGEHKERSLILCTSDLHLEWQCWTATYNKDFYRIYRYIAILIFV